MVRTTPFAKPWGAWQTALRGGVIAAVPVPLDRDGRLDQKSQERYVNAMARVGLAGVAVWAHTGRGPHLDGKLRREVMAHWRGTGELVAGIGIHGASPGTFERQALELAEEALRLGATSLLVHPPRSLLAAVDPEQRIVAYHEALGRLGAPLIAFELYEAASGVTYTPVVWRELFALPSVAAVKFATLDSPMRVQDLIALAQGSGTLLITGEDRFLAASLMFGCQAALVGIAAARPELSVELVSAWQQARLESFVRLAAAIDRYAQVVFRDPMEGYIQRLLDVLATDGWIDGAAASDPWGPTLDPDDLADVRRFARGAEAT